MLSVRAGERKDFSVGKVLILSSFYHPLPRVLAGVISECWSARVDVWAPWGCPAHRLQTGAVCGLYGLGEFIQDLDMGGEAAARGWWVVISVFFSLAPVGPSEVFSTYFRGMRLL